MAKFCYLERVVHVGFLGIITSDSNGSNTSNTLPL